MRILKLEGGNIFAMLFAAVAMTGVLGVVGMQTVSGPITTITKVTQKNMIDTDLMTNARVVILDAGLRPAGGDGDSDNYVEPAPFNTTCSKNPAGGGCLPSDIGAVLTDPFGTPYGYCVWDHGSVNVSADRLSGKDDTSAAVIAIISAGADKTFQTSCEPFDGNAPEGLVEAPTSDDSVRIYTYDTAVAGANGLWQVKDGDPNVAQIAKNLEVGDVGAGTGFSFDTSTGEGDFPRIKTDIIQAKTGQNADVLGGLRLDDQVGVTNCAAGDSGVVRYNNTDGRIEVCDGSEWNAGGDTWRIIDEDHGSNTYVTVAGTGNTNTDEIAFVTAGSQRMVIDSAGNVGLGTNSTSLRLEVSGSSKMTYAGGPNPALEVYGRTKISGNPAWLQMTNEAASNTFNIVASADDLSILENTTSGSQVSLGINDRKVGIGGQAGGATLTVRGDTYMYNNLQVAGTMNVDTATNHVGIGTSSPLVDLHIRNTAPTIRLDGDATKARILTEGQGLWLQAGAAATSGSTQDINFSGFNGTPRHMTVKGTGNVGIGTSSPNSKLQVAGAIQVANDAASCTAGKAGAIRYNSTDIQYCNGSVWALLQGYVASLNDIGDVDVEGVSTGQTIVWDGSDWVATSTLDAVSSGDSDLLIDNDGDTQIQVEKGNDDDHIRFDTAGSQKMVILPNGNVGIGTNTPITQLEVYGSISSRAGSLLLQKPVSTGGWARGMMLTDNGSVDPTSDGLAGFGFYGAGNNPPSSIYMTHGTAPWGSTRGIHIISNGNVGVGTTGPQASLDVAGTGSILFPRGTSGNRPAPAVNGMMRYNTGTGKYEAYQGGSWQDILTSAVGNVASSMEDEDGDTWIRVSADNGSDNDTIRMATNGTVGMTIQSDGNIVVPTGKAIGNTFDPNNEYSIYFNTPVNGMTQLGGSAPYGSGMLLKADSMIGFGESDADALVGYMNVNTDEFVWGGDIVSESLTVSDDVGIAWESGVNRITHNDGGGNVQIRFGNDYTSSDERYTHGGGAMYIGGNIDATSGTAMELKVSSNAGAGDNQPVAWGDTLAIGADTITFGGVDLMNTDGGDADTLDGLNSTQFIRSDVDDVTTGNLGFSSGNGRGLRFWNSDNYKIYMSSATDTTWGGRLATNSDYNMYFQMTGGTNRGFVFKNGTNNVAHIDGQGSGYFEGDIYLDGKQAFSGSDSYLRLNQNNNFSSGTYTPGLIRADGGFQVDGNFMINSSGAIHTAQHNDNSRYGYFEGRTDAGARGFYLGYGNGGSTVNLQLDNANRLEFGGGVLDMNNNAIVGLPTTPSAANDAASKAYVDSAVSSGNADQVDGLHASQFIRSDADDVVSGHTEWQDNYEIRLGSGADFRMDFNGSHTYMRSYAHGANLYMQGEDAGGTNRAMIYANPDGAVDLYYAGSNKLSTAFGGVDVTGNMVASGDVYANGQDVRIGSNGGGNSHLRLYDDTNNTWRTIYWDDGGSRFRLNNNVLIDGSLNMNSDKIIGLSTPTAGTDAANKAYVDSAVSSGDADRVDGLHAASFIRSDADDSVTAHTEWLDSRDVRLGSDADFRMMFNGTDTYMRSFAHGSRWILQGEDGGGSMRSMIISDPDNSVDLYYGGGRKAMTTATGLNFAPTAGNAPTR